MTVGVSSSSSSSDIRIDKVERVPSGSIAVLDSSDTVDIPKGWLLADGSNGTVDLEKRYPKMAGSSGSSSGSLTTNAFNHKHSVGTYNPGFGSTASGVPNDNSNDVSVDLQPNSQSVIFIQSFAESRLPDNVIPFSEVEADTLPSEFSESNLVSDDRYMKGDSSGAGSTFGSTTADISHTHSFGTRDSDNRFDQIGESTTDSATLTVEYEPPYHVLRILSCSRPSFGYSSFPEQIVFLYAGDVSELPPTFEVADGTNFSNDLTGKYLKVSPSTTLNDSGGSDVLSTISGNHSHNIPVAGGDADLNDLTTVRSGSTGSTNPSNETPELAHTTVVPIVRVSQ